MSDRAQAGGGKVTTFETGVVARLSQAVSYVVRGVTPATWFGPGQPMKPLAPEGTGIRQYDYAFGSNMTYTPRKEEAISFSQLRAMAEYDLVRLAIETVKGQVERVPFNIKPRGATSLGGKPGTSAEGDPRVDRAEAFFMSPDGEHDWATWVRALIEEMLVTDAATIYPRMTNGGDLYSLELVDGSTISRVIDEAGRTPIPPSVAYQQVIKGAVAGDYTRETLLYRPRNYRAHKVYGYSPVEQILMTINIGLRRELKQLAHFTEGNMSDTIIGTPSGWTTEMIKVWQSWWDSEMAGNAVARSRGRFVPGEIAKNVFDVKTPPLKDEFDEWIARVVAYAFNLPPTWAVKQMNRATAETAQNSALEEGLAPILVWIKSIMDSVIARYMNAPDLEFVWSNQKEIDPKIASEIDNSELELGVINRDEHRARRGLDPLPDGMGKVYTVAGSTIARLEDAIKEPEPTPPALLGHNGGPPLDPNDPKAKNAVPAPGEEGDDPVPDDGKKVEADPKKEEVGKLATVPFSRGQTRL